MIGGRGGAEQRVVGLSDPVRRHQADHVLQLLKPPVEVVLALVLVVLLRLDE